jgi:hypothetical protein
MVSCGSVSIVIVLSLDGSGPSEISRNRSMAVRAIELWNTLRIFLPGTGAFYLKQMFLNPG